MLDPTNYRPLASGNIALLDDDRRLVLKVVTVTEHDEMIAADEAAEAEAFEAAARAEEANERWFEDRGYWDPADDRERWLESLAS
jgi:hypothetical protein